MDFRLQPYKCASCISCMHAQDALACSHDCTRWACACRSESRQVGGLKTVRARTNLRHETANLPFHHEFIESKINDHALAFFPLLFKPLAESPAASTQSPNPFTVILISSLLF
jgi:hypothetical protein